MKVKPTLNQAVKFLEQVQNRNAECFDLQELLESGLFNDLLRCQPKTIDRVQFQVFLGIREIVPVVIHRTDWSRLQMIEAGNYLDIDPRLSKQLAKMVNLPKFHDTNGSIEIHTICFAEALTPLEAREKLLRLYHLRPADFTELLALGAVKNTPREYEETLALDSHIINNHAQHSYPVFGYNSDRKTLYLSRPCVEGLDTRLPSLTRFAGVPIN